MQISLHAFHFQSGPAFWTVWHFNLDFAFFHIVGANLHTYILTQWNWTARITVELDAGYASFFVFGAWGGEHQWLLGCIWHEMTTWRHHFDLQHPSPDQRCIPLLQAKVVLSLHWQTSASASCPMVRRGNSWQTEVPGPVIDRLGGAHNVHFSKWFIQISNIHPRHTHTWAKSDWILRMDQYIIFSDESRGRRGVALNVDFMEELSQAVRLVREDLTLLSKAVRDAAMKLSALHSWRSWTVILGKIRHTVDGRNPANQLREQ